ncbi:MAG: hypothetical protein HQM01_15295 [Magnetococcales bacterium]|nr:hypothetical protein [Magnetococcales bacterium]
MSTMSFDLKPREGALSKIPEVQFTFAPETQKFGGRDGEMVGQYARQFLGGSIGVMPCYTHPVGDRLTLIDLTAILLDDWDLRDSGLPPVEIPEDDGVPREAVY